MTNPLLDPRTVDYRDHPLERDHSTNYKVSDEEYSHQKTLNLPLSHPDLRMDWADYPLSSFLPQSTEEYQELEDEMYRLARSDQETWAHRMRLLATSDLVWLLSEVLSTRTWIHPEQPGLKLFHHPFLIRIAREAQFLTKLYELLTILSRGHCKSTIWTYGEQIRMHLEDPTMCSIIFSIVNNVAQPFLRQIKNEFENNDLLRSLFPDRIWENPKKQAEGWSLSTGLFLPNPKNYKDPSLKAVGLIDGSTTGNRLEAAFYDDVVNEKMVTNPEMIDKANKRWELSLNLGTPKTKRFYVGTFYAAGDSYHHILASQIVRLNFHSCYEVNWEKSTFSDNGVPSKIVLERSAPTLFSRKYLERQELLMGATMFAVQMIGAPASYEVTEFREEWFPTYSMNPEDMKPYVNTLILVDPANSKGSNSHSRTAMVVLGLGKLGRIYLLDGIIDRLNLSERTDALFDLVTKWGTDHPVRYEELGHHSDIDHIRTEMDRRACHFEIWPVKGNIPKPKRIERLIPHAKAKRIYVPKRGIPYVMRETNQLIDVWRWALTKEFLPFPNAVHFDFIDAFARLDEPGIMNEYRGEQSKKRDIWRDSFYSQDEPAKPAVGWMSS